MIVKVSWKEHNREYSIGIIKFLKLLGYDVDETHVKKVVKEYISRHGQ